MNDIVIARVQLNDVLDKIQGIAYELTLDEMDALIDEVTCLYERYSDVVEMRNGVKPE